MAYRLGSERTLLLAIEPTDGPGQTVLASDLHIAEVQQLQSIPGDGEVGLRRLGTLPTGGLDLNFGARIEVTRSTSVFESLAAVPRLTLPPEAIPYLRPSRYCQSDRLTTFAGSQFGNCEGGRKILAIRDWVARQIEYVPGSSDENTTALDTFVARQGVCRDYAHLVCAFARAANIPARCVAVYGPDVQPPDFHAVAEVYLEGGWHIVDATGMSSADALAIIVAGRDAADIAFLDAGDGATMKNQKVSVRREEPGLTQTGADKSPA